jgi:hypothetical protein
VAAGGLDSETLSSVEASFNISIGRFAKLLNLHYKNTYIYHRCFARTKIK